MILRCKYFKHCWVFWQMVVSWTMVRQGGDFEVGDTRGQELTAIHSIFFYYLRYIFGCIHGFRLLILIKVASSCHDVRGELVRHSSGGFGVLSFLMKYNYSSKPYIVPHPKNFTHWLKCVISKLFILTLLKVYFNFLRQGLVRYISQSTRNTILL